MDGFLKAFFDFGGHYGAGHKEAIDFWVAAGTVLSAIATAFLAFVTFISVWFTARLLRGETKRHQQQFAPILMVAPVINGNALVGFDVVNHGLGPALNCGIELLFEASVSKSDTAKVNSVVYYPILPQKETWKMRFADSTEESEGYATFDASKTFGKTMVHYSDLFGNVYWSHLPSVTRSTFPKWIPPEYLFGKQKEGAKAVVDFALERIDHKRDEEQRRKSDALYKQTMEQMSQLREDIDALKDDLHKK